MLQRYTLLLFFYGYLTIFFRVFSSFLCFLSNALTLSQGGNLAIDLAGEHGGIATLVFLGQFIFQYLHLALTWIVLFFTFALLFAWLIEIIKQRKVNVLILIVILSLLSVLALPTSNLFYVSIFGVIVLYLPTYVLNASIFEYHGLKAWMEMMKNAFSIHHGDNLEKSEDVFGYFKSQQCDCYTGNMAITILLNVMFHIGTIVSFGLLSGILVYVKDNYELNHTCIANRKVVYKSYWYVWLFKGFKWTLLTLVTLGLYPLLGGLGIDYYQTRYASTHFEHDQGQSFFDGTFGEYCFYRVIGGLGCVLTLGLAYPIFNRYIHQFLATHSIIDGHRLSYMHPLKDDFNNFKKSYPLFIVTFGLAGIAYQYSYQCYQKSHLAIDIDPKLYSEDEDYELFHGEDTYEKINDVASIIRLVEESKAKQQSTDIPTDSSKVTEMDNFHEKVVKSVKKPVKKTTKKPATVDRNGKRILKRVNRNQTPIKTNASANNQNTKSIKANNTKTISSKVSTTNSNAKDVNKTQKQAKIQSKQTNIVTKTNVTNKKVSLPKTTVKPVNTKESATNKQVNQAKTKKANNHNYTMPVASKKMAKKLKRGK